MHNPIVIIAGYVCIAFFYASLFGIPICFLYLKKVRPVTNWVICFMLSAVAIFFALQFVQSTLGYPISEVYRAEMPDDDDRKYSDTGASAILLIIGLPYGMVSTAIVFGLAALWRFVRRKLSD